MYRYTAEGKQILSVNGCTGQSKFLHVDFFFPTITVKVNYDRPLYPLPLQRASEPLQEGFVGTFFVDLVSRHLRYVHYEGILHD